MKPKTCPICDVDFDPKTEQCDCVDSDRSPSDYDRDLAMNDSLNNESVD